MRFWCQLGFIFDPKISQNRVLEASWAVLGASWGVLEASWAVLGPPWRRLGPSWRPVGTIEAIMAASWDAPGDIQAVPAEFWHQKDAKGGAAGATRSGMRGAPFGN